MPSVLLLLTAVCSGNPECRQSPSISTVRVIPLLTKAGCNAGLVMVRLWDAAGSSSPCTGGDRSRTFSRSCWNSKADASILAQPDESLVLLKATESINQEAERALTMTVPRRRFFKHGSLRRRGS